MLDAVPFIAFVSIVIASLLRGEVISRRSGDRAWAFTAARGKQRAAGLAFALGIVASAAAGLDAAVAGGRDHPIIGAFVAIVGAAVVIVAQIQMGRAWRVGVRAGDAPLFIRHGLFRFSRNPIFVGMALIGSV